MFEKCQFITSAVKMSQSPNKNNLPEFVFVGRSNVGKSSTINAITKRKKICFLYDFKFASNQVSIKLIYIKNKVISNL